MGALDRLRRRGNAEDLAVPPPGGSNPLSGPSDKAEEGALRARLSEDPNDIQAFNRLAEIVGENAAEHQENVDPDRDLQRDANDAVWALAEEIAQSNRAWYPLLELARLSIDDDRDMALRRLATAADRDESGLALAHGLAVLRESGHPDDALGLGVGHWRPKEHTVETGRQLIEAAVESGRFAEARRHLDALAANPDVEGVERLRKELDKKISQHERGGGVRHDPPGGPGTRYVDVRDERTSRLRNFLRR